MRRVLVAVAAAWLAGCLPADRELPPEATAALLVRPDFVSLPAGSERQLSAQANGKGGAAIPEAPIVYASSDPNVLAVSSRGLISARGATGSVEVIVTSGSAKRVVPVTITPGAPASLTKVSGDRQSALATSALPEPIAVVVRDAYGNPIPNALVSFVASEGTVEPPQATSSPSGVAEAHWTLGALAGSQRLTVEIAKPSAAITQEFVAVAQAGGLAKLEKLGADARPIPVGATIAPRVRATDEFGNPLGGVAVLWRVSEGGGSTETTVTETNVDGLATTDWTVGRSVGRNVIVARAAGLAQQDVQFAVSAVAGGPAKLEALADTSGERSAEPLPAVRVVDAFENPVPAVLVRFRILSGGGVLKEEAAMTDDDGIARVESWEPESTPAEVEASAPGISETVRFRTREPD